MKLDHLMKPEKLKKPLYAVVVCTLEGEKRTACIVTGTRFLLEDIETNLCSRYAGDSLGNPDGPGLWMWEGNLHERDYDADYRGTYRRLSEDEINKLVTGTPLIEWDKDPLEEDLPEENSTELLRI